MSTPVLTSALQAGGMMFVNAAFGFRGLGVGPVWGLSLGLTLTFFHCKRQCLLEVWP